MRRLRADASAGVLGLMVLLVVLGAVIASRALLGVTHGLHADYFANVSRDGPPARSVVTSELSTDRLTADWDGRPPPAFSARWFGYLMVGRTGTYTFGLNSDDGSMLWIDTRLVVDNSGPGGTHTRTGAIELAHGPHLVVVEYTQAGGPFQLAWSWGRDAAQLAPVPSWVLSPTRVGYRTSIIARTLDVLRTGLAVACGLLVVWMVSARLSAPGARFVGAYPRAASLLLFVALAVVHTWPLATNPAHLSRNDNGDTLLNEWTLAWVAHQAVHDPIDLFNANIFYPERNTLAYSESLIVQSAMGAPLLWLGASPVLTYNVVLLAGFVLTGWTMSLVVGRWTGDWLAGVAAGSLAAFNAHNLTRLPHLQAQHMEFLPLALLALDTLIREPRVAHALRLALWFTLQALTSIHLLVFSAFALAASMLVRPDAWRQGRGWRVAGQLALAAVIAVLVLAPFLLPYWAVHLELGFTRPLSDAGWFAASWRDYLGTPGRIHFTLWSQHVFTGVALFPGVAGLSLAAVALAHGVAIRDPRARMCLAFGICGLVLSFGTKLPIYGIVYQLVPMLGAIRAVSRFGILLLLAVAVLAGFGLAIVRSGLSERFRGRVTAVILALLIVEPLAAPISYSRFEAIPAIYDRLRSEPHAVVVELPFPDARSAFANGQYMLNSTRHWKPILNGYSGLLPVRYGRYYDSLKDFPSPASLGALQAAGVTHVFVHTDSYPPQVLAELNDRAGLSEVAREGPIVLYHLVPGARHREASLR